MGRISDHTVFHHFLVYPACPHVPDTSSFDTAPSQDVRHAFCTVDTSSSAPCICFPVSRLLVLPQDETRSTRSPSIGTMYHTICFYVTYAVCPTHYVVPGTSATAQHTEHYYIWYEPGLIGNHAWWSPALETLCTLNVITSITLYSPRCFFLSAHCFDAPLFPLSHLSFSIENLRDATLRMLCFIVGHTVSTPPALTLWVPPSSFFSENPCHAILRARCQLVGHTVLRPFVFALWVPPPSFLSSNPRNTQLFAHWPRLLHLPCSTDAPPTWNRRLALLETTTRDFLHRALSSQQLQPLQPGVKYIRKARSLIPVRASQLPMATTLREFDSRQQQFLFSLFIPVPLYFTWIIMAQKFIFYSPLSLPIPGPSYFAGYVSVDDSCVPADPANGPVFYSSEMDDNDEVIIFFDRADAYTAYKRYKADSSQAEAVITEHNKSSHVNIAYKRVDKKVKPVPGVFPEDVKVICKFPEDPLASLVPLPKQPPEFLENGCLTAERLEGMNINPDGFLWSEEEKLFKHILQLHQNAFVFEDSSRGTFREDYFSPYIIPIVPHEPWTYANIPIPPGIREKVIVLLKRK